MRRLTYAPKAYVYVRSRNHKNKIFDLTDYVVSGEVNRLVNQKSNASVVLRNNFFQFSPEMKDSFFLPMDAITIWLQRIKNKPIQVFTGYLNSVPYMQLYPGNCQITASCTLKRLENTYFDPTINATMQFFNAMGWTPDGSGGYSNPAFNIGQDAKGRNVASDAFSVNGASNDSGIGNVIKPFLTEIGGWDPSQVLVSDLPTDLPKKAAKLYDRISAENQSVLDGLEALLKGIMTLSSDTTPAASQTTVQFGVVNDIYKAASDKNIDPTVMVTAALVLSQMDKTYVGPDGSVGLYACPNSSVATASNTSKDPGLGVWSTDDFFSTPRVSTSANYDGKTAKQMTDPAVATAAFAQRLLLADPKKTFQKQASKQNLDAVAEWIAKAQGVPVKSIASQVLNVYGTAAKLVDAWAGSKINANSPLLTGSAAEQLPPGLSWTDTGNMFSQTSLNDRGIWQHYYPKVYDSLAPYLYVAHKMGLRLTQPPTVVQGRKDIIVIGDLTKNQENNSNMTRFFNWARSAGADIVRYQATADKTDGVEYHGGVKVQGSQQQSDWPQGFVYIQTGAVSIYPTWTGNPAGDSNNSNSVPGTSPTDPNSVDSAQNNNGTQPLTFEDIATMGLQAAFYAQVNFPGNAAASQLLTGDKALMNDIPVMEGVKQLCGGSMRNFMSLPDGSFCAFYPDYFGGSNRKPYWAITDMEIINMGIQLSDQALATHVYVTGATTAQPGLINLQDEVTTLGVVTLQHMFGDGTFVSGDIKGSNSGDVVGREIEAYQFLKFYGARPLAVQQPLIRNGMFEFLYAWQLFMYMWAAQFQTTCQFTFQPEMMAGGRVAFPDHGLEMYIESVHHQFSYETGFLTTAVLQAPTTTVKDPNAANYRPGMALAGNNLGNIGAI